MTSLNYLEERPRQRVRQMYLPRRQRGALFVSRLRKSIGPQNGRKFAPHFDALDLVAAGEPYRELEERPNQESLDIARAVLHALESSNLEPTRVMASVEGGVGICFVNGDKYADIECFNSGEILGVVSNRRDRPSIWKVEPSAFGFAEAARRIRSFLAGAPISDVAKR